MKCLRKFCNHCDSEFLKDLLRTLDESVNKNKDSIEDSESGYTVCEPGMKTMLELSSKLNTIKPLKKSLIIHVR